MVETLKQFKLKIDKFRKLAQKRELYAKLKDIEFIQAYIKLCSKHKRFMGSLTPENNITHLRSSKIIKNKLNNTKFRAYNRHEDNYPTVGSGWHI